MSKIPKFRLYGKDDPRVEESIQPHLELRGWNQLDTTEKKNAFQEIVNSGWFDEYADEILEAIEHLNYHFLQQCPGRNLHRIKPEVGHLRMVDKDYNRLKAALVDFQEIFLGSKSEDMVYRMITKFSEAQIDKDHYNIAEEEKDEEKIKEHIEIAFQNFDRLANCFNHIFEQFSVNVILTRNGLVPRQDEKITEEIYIPTLKILADPKWKNVSNDLAEMFEDYQKENYSEVVTKAHRTVQRFLQILVGEEGKSGKGEVKKLFGEAKEKGIIPIDRFTEPIIRVFQSFISSERATKSTAKPTLKEANSSDALLIMNVIMVFLQHCLQRSK